MPIIKKGGETRDPSMFAEPLPINILKAEFIYHLI